MSRPSSPIQPADPAARPRWEHSPASASVSLSAGPSPSKATKRTEPVDTIDLTKTKQEEQEDTDERIEKMDQGDVEQEERSQRTEKRIEEMEMEKVDHVTVEDGPTTKDSGTKLTPPSPLREKSISRETDGQVNTTKPEQGEFFLLHLSFFFSLSLSVRLLSGNQSAPDGKGASTAFPSLCRLNVPPDGAG
jgi:hypothetical protein